MKVENLEKKIKELDEVTAVEILAQVLAIVFDKDTKPEEIPQKVVEVLKDADK
ncbi:MAG TPA: hypothetical protein H9727_06090 [Candidatus Borkfalkia avistercoris]|uniref:Uncharacterized protein n=1 Tax=Candidatus Borkfalkia avistercoris TaxID=2838504 RepID=A0A9D2ID67_9FIRM|nr:hypothetical protein [Candidatus Borkfalkia avistercoris]